MSDVHSVAKLSTILCCSLFSGAALYINLVEHPARMECGTHLAATVFGPSYRRAAILQGSLAAVGLVSSVVSWRYGSSDSWLVAGLLLGSVVPVTFLGIMPTNKKLLDPKVDKESPVTKSLLQKWGKLHGIRTVLSMAALLIILVDNGRK